MANIKELVQEIVAAKKDKGGIKQVYFVGCGGSYGAGSKGNPHRYFQQW